MAKLAGIHRWNTPAFAEVRSAPGVVQLVDETAESVADELGAHYEAFSRPGKSRYRSRIYARGVKGRQHDRKHNAMLAVATARGMKLIGGE